MAEHWHDTPGARGPIPRAGTTPGGQGTQACQGSCAHRLTDRALAYGARDGGSSPPGRAAGWAMRTALLPSGGHPASTARPVKGWLAQLEERCFHTAEAAGSSPALSTVPDPEVAEGPGCEPGFSGFEFHRGPHDDFSSLASVTRAAKGPACKAGASRFGGSSPPAGTCWLPGRRLFQGAGYKSCLIWRKHM